MQYIVEAPNANGKFASVAVYDEDAIIAAKQHVKAIIGKSPSINHHMMPRIVAQRMIPFVTLNGRKLVVRTVVG